MDSPPKLSGETLIVHHIPLVHCQVSGGRQTGCGGSLKRGNPFNPPENLGLSRTTSLPERDVLQREALLYSSLIQTSSGSWSSRGGDTEKKHGGRGGSTASDDSSFTSSNSEDQLITAHTLPRAKPRNRNPLRHNPFLLNVGDDEDEEDEDVEDNLNGYLEDSSFHLHSDTGLALEDAMVPFHLHDLSFASEPFLLHSSRESLRGAASDLSNHLDDLDILGQRRHGSSGSNISMDCGEHDWADEDEEEDHPMGCGRSGEQAESFSSNSSTQHCSCCALSQNFPQTFSEAFSELQEGYGSDSSCNSSEGVLVNFSALYNRMNNSSAEKPLTSRPTNRNGSTDHSCTSSVSDLPANQQDSSGGAFYLDLHTSPTEPPLPQQQGPGLSSNFPLLREPHLSVSSSCSCSMEHHGSLDLDANCNSYLPPPAGSSGELASCLQSQARLVVATQNYYKLVTCDLSSQSSPSPEGSSANSCSEEPSKGSPTPTQPSEYFLFGQRGAEGGLEEEDEDGDTKSSRQDEKDDEEEEDNTNADCADDVIEGQVYVNVSPPIAGRSVPGSSSSGSRLRSRSYDRNLDQSPSLGSLERMLSCPVRLSEGGPAAPMPPRVTSFAEIARSKRRNGGTGGSPSAKAAADPFSSSHSSHSHSSADFSPIPEHGTEPGRPAAAPEGFAWLFSHGSIDRQPERPKQDHTSADGGLLCSSGSPAAVVRYSKEQRPTSLPIQPFTFHHQFTSKPPQPKPLLPLLTGYVSGMQAPSGSGSGGAVAEEGEDVDENVDPFQAPLRSTAPPLDSVRPSPLGSYSPVRLQGAPSSGTCSTCTPSPQSAHSHPCPLSAGLGPLHTPPAVKAPTPPPPLLGVKRGVVPPSLQGHCFHQGGPRNTPPPHSDSLSPLGILDSGKHSDGGKGSGPRALHAHHLSPQALKWREYRRRNPLGLERLSAVGSAPHSGTVELSRAGGPRLTRRNVFDFPAAHSGWSNAGLSVKLQQSYSESLLPDYFSLTEKPPEEFCLSPDASTSSSSACSTSQPQISVDLKQKRVLVKAVNTAVDLIVAHFGTSRDPDVKAKLGNSWVSPNVGHLILKYLCPALRDVLQDGLKAYMLDLIVGQRRCQPWSVVEASTQLGPSTRILHSLFSKVSQFSELTSHNMRLNAFIFGLLNLKSLEFWFNHLYTHEDILAAHYSPLGLLPLSQAACRPLFEEILLLLQPLSLLPFDLDLLFEPRLLQKGREQLRRKELLCSESAVPSGRSTFQLTRGETVRQSGDTAEGGIQPGLRRETMWRESEGAQRGKGVGQESRSGGHRKVREPAEDRQAGWWYQLMQSSQVYIDQSTEGSKFVKPEKRRRPSDRRQHQAPPTREGVVEGAESSYEAEGGKSRSGSSSGGLCAAAGGRPSWMGSPPESVLNQGKDSNLAVTSARGHTAGQEESAPHGQSRRWGRLFGSTAASPHRPDEAGQRGRGQKPRLPSGWLGLDRSILDLVAGTIGAGGVKEAEPPATSSHSQPSAPPSDCPADSSQQPQCQVKALCHHIATEPGQLSFSKGDVLQVFSKADPDWLLCSLGSAQGLVPIVYVTLLSMEDSHTSALHV